MEAKQFFYACIVGLLLAVWLADSAPIDSLSDEEHLRQTLYKLDAVLGELIQRTEDSQSSYSKRNEALANPTSSSPERRSGWVKSSNPDGPVPYRTLKRGNEDPEYARQADVFPPGYYGNLLERALQRRRVSSDVNAPSGASENNLRKVLRYLADMEQKLQKRDHDIPFPFVGRRAHEKK